MSVDIPWRTSDKRQRTVLAHEATDLTSMRVGWMVPLFLFGCDMIPVSGHGGEIAEAEASRMRGHGATGTWRTDTAHGPCMRAVSSLN